MKTRLIQIATLLLLLGAANLAAAAERQPVPVQQAVAASTADAADGQRDRLSWQRVGAPEEGIG
ncbi:hypothetical protein EZJ19_10160 [Parasulfuritortus cantonensis]|uniref:Uncharacterized protein n=1 Tax=Parasulfuritortus cantonensis TaxID=2528202 RepID=A0A4V2NVH7_9PROT|nr:hypothetical protein [Parasulfuritortus cantonensis]TCJ13512.1 hypothetical protein EZJ19_10160 [Parasulfuritortus cantonensis]